MLQLVVKCTHDVTGWWPATSWVHYTTSCNTKSSAPEDGQTNCPKHVELTGIINKPLLFYLVGCLYYLYFIIFFETLWTDRNKYTLHYFALLNYTNRAVVKRRSTMGDVQFTCS